MRTVYVTGIEIAPFSGITIEYAMSAIGCAICVCSRANSSDASDSSVGYAKLSDDAEHAITAGHAKGD